MLEAERKIREYLQSCNGSGGDVRLILDHIIELAKTDPLGYESLRKKIAGVCAVRASVLDAEVVSKPEDGDKAAAIIFTDPEPCSETVNGAELLDEISRWLRGYVILPPGAADAISAWALATWFVDELYFAPLLVLLSPTKRAGKTLLLDLLQHVVRRGQPTSGIGISPAVLFRLSDEWSPTFLIDEAEKLGGMREGSHEVIGLLNAGHRRGGMVQRCSGDDHHVENFDAFGFRAVAAIGRLWSTLLDRSISVHMMRKSSSETVERFKAREIENEGRALAGKIASWTQDHRDEIGDAEANAPRPEWLNDRSSDNWSPLLGVGTLAGHGWLDRLLDVAGKLEGGKEEFDRGEQLIFDIQSIFSEMGNPPVIASGELVGRLKEREESPWADLRGSGLTANKLARMLRKFSVRPGHHRLADGRDARGYRLAEFENLFSRYNPPCNRHEVSQPLESSTYSDSKCHKGTCFNGSKSLKTKPVTVVTVGKRQEGGGEEKNITAGVRCMSCRTLQDIDGDSARCAMHKNAT